MKYYLGIDNGGTSTKAVVFDSKGRQLGKSSKNLPLETPYPGFTERSMNDLWKVNVEVIKEAVQKSGVDGSLISGISCCGHGKGLYVLGKDGNYITNGIVSTDARGSVYVDKWKVELSDYVREENLQDLMACQQICLLRWIKDNRPDVYDQIGYVFSVKDFIRFKLTGEAYSELTDISGSNLLSLKKSCIDKTIFEKCGIEEIFDCVPPIKSSFDICGRITAEASDLTGLPIGIPVSGGMFDIDACAIASGVLDSSILSVIAGTWGINQYISTDPVVDGSIRMNSLYCLRPFFLIEESSATSAGNLEWFINSVMADKKKELGSEIYSYCNDLVASVHPSEDVPVFLPFIFGSNYNARSRASFVGLSSQHSLAHMVRAVFEGIVFCHMIHIEKLIKVNPGLCRVRLSGGAAKSSVWAQMFADIIGMPVETVEVDELGALGCAISTAVAVGEYSSVKEAVSEMTSVSRVFVPDNNHFYDKRFEEYRAIYESLEEYWKRKC